MPEGRFADRLDAGRVLAGRLRHLHDRPCVVLGLPRGGVPVASEVARELDAPLDVFVVRKLGAPGREELAMGAVASGGVVVLNDEVVRALGIGPEVVEQVTARERREMQRREQAYREGRPQPQVTGRVGILVDDGLATGASMRAAVEALRRRDPARVVVAVPTAPESACRELEAMADEVVCASAPPAFASVGEAYEDFAQTTDDEVRDVLRAASPGKEGPADG
jgi:predicted phosphoribosyltransferase